MGCEWTGRDELLLVESGSAVMVSMETMLRLRGRGWEVDSGMTAQVDSGREMVEEDLMNL